MASENVVSSQLRLTFYDGVDPETGDPVYVRKNFNNVDPEAAAADLSAVAKAFSSLQTRDLQLIERQDLSEIEE